MTTILTNSDNKYMFNKAFSNYIKCEWKYAPELLLDEFINFINYRDCPILSEINSNKRIGFNGKKTFKENFISVELFKQVN